MAFFCRRQASEQNFTSAQFFAQARRQLIGRPQAAEGDDQELAALGGLRGDEVWPVDIAYFDMDDASGEELPTYRISFKLHPGGVTRDLVMDYGDFSLNGKLVDLAVFDPPKDCAD